jgi:glucosamine--fructose-6-phosphate aminotransferase (isomerizing)
MSDMPELRDGPPWAMEEMILAEPGLVAAIFNSPEALEAAEWIRETETVVVTGCGTSEHAAMAGAALLGARSRDAFEASLDPQREGVLIAVSHEAGTAATLAAMRATSARTILITARPEVDTGADLVIGTPLVDTSWCHTVGYVSPLLAFTAIASATDAGTASRIIEGTLAQRARFAAAAQTLDGCERR